jgi:solute carrier family 25 (mitochondrial phosphate transporter), member 23/24/25/41
LLGFFNEIDMNRDGYITFEEWRYVSFSADEKALPRCDLGADSRSQSDFLLFMPQHHDGPVLEAALSFYQHIVTVSAEGDSLVSEDTLEGLGTTGFLLHALFGSLLKIANPESTAFTRPLPPSPAFPTSDAPQASGDPGTAGLSEMASAASSRYAYGAAAASPQILTGATTRGARLPIDDAEQLDRISDYQLEEVEVVEIRLTDLLPEPGYFLAGAVSGAVSRTATAPLDRLKVYLLVSTKARSTVAVSAAKQGKPLVAIRNASGPIVEAVTSLWKAGGFRTFFAGKGYVHTQMNAMLTHCRKWAQCGQDHARISYPGMHSATFTAGFGY